MEVALAVKSQALIVEQGLSNERLARGLFFLGWRGRSPPMNLLG
ncbi:hypothetical protein [Leptolyngbya sp. O-77]|nr:hypothetical protein [Leptolyngbya sp. O-77]